ncbi:hypothetical protein ACLB1E_34895 [Escherichia coli]
MQSKRLAITLPISLIEGVHLKQHITAWEGQRYHNHNAMLHHFKQAATLAVNSIQNEAICDRTTC